MIFVDSSAWFARYTPRDRNHAAAKRFHEQTRELLLTTDYVIDEVLTLLKVRGNVERAIRVGKRSLAANSLGLNGSPIQTSSRRGRSFAITATSSGASRIV